MKNKCEFHPAFLVAVHPAKCLNLVLCCAFHAPNGREMTAIGRKKTKIFISWRYAVISGKTM
jgi:hypothetical protein